MIRQVVANNVALKHFSKIDIFRIDLGNNLTGAVSNKNSDIKIKISDDFIQRYKNNTRNLIFKYGNIGKLTFYIDTTLKNDELIVFDDDVIYEIDIEDIQTLANEPRKYLSNLLEKLSNNINTKNDEFDIKNTIISTKPEDLEVPDISLPYEQYIEKLVEHVDKKSKLY